MYICCQQYYTIVTIFIVRLRRTTRLKPKMSPLLRSVGQSGS
jgi:hypothetical protein